MKTSALLTLLFISNPIIIGDNILNWINGRELSKYISSNKEVTYKYNKDGIRTSKDVNGVVTNYYLEGNKIIVETRGEDVIYYTRDENGELIGIEYQDKTYFYKKNYLGDIIGIYNSNYEQIVNYKYDSWGNIISITDNLGNEIIDETNIGIINPFRYRSYYYDEETKLYYLNSRYYNPKWGRFINADSYIGSEGVALLYNFYTYCDNDPINKIDKNGDFAIVVPYIIDILKDLITALLVLLLLNVTEKVIENADFNKPTIKDSKENKETKIYRYNGMNPGNFFPRKSKRYRCVSCYKRWKNSCFSMSYRWNIRRLVQSRSRFYMDKNIKKYSY